MRGAAICRSNEAAAGFSRRLFVDKRSRGKVSASRGNKSHFVIPRALLPSMQTKPLGACSRQTKRNHVFAGVEVSVIEHAFPPGGMGRACSPRPFTIVPSDEADEVGMLVFIVGSGFIDHCFVCGRSSLTRQIVRVWGVGAIRIVPRNFPSPVANFPFIKWRKRRGVGRFVRPSCSMRDWPGGPEL